MRYENRADAGRRLARRLEHLRDGHVVVLGVPRGGVPVAFEVARHLGAPLDLAVVRKLRVPWQPELGFGALGEHGVRVINQEVLRESGLTSVERETLEQVERAELERRVRRWRDDRAPLPLAGRSAVVLHDAVATGAAAEAACQVARARDAARVILAVPVGTEESLAYLRAVADEVVCVQPLRHLGSVGAWYEDFAPITDSEITTLLAEAERAVTASGHDLPPEGPYPGRAVEVPAPQARMAARLTLPPTARAVVVFAHAGSSGRHDRRIQYVAAALHRAGLGTLLLDLLTEDEERNRHNVFDITMLARRLHAASRWLRRETGVPVSYCAADTGVGAVLEAAAADEEIRAVVSIGGRPDLARPAALARVRAPTLFVVGAMDSRLLGCNHVAADWMRCEHRIEVVPDATRLLTEPGPLETVAELTRHWFTTPRSARSKVRAAPAASYPAPAVRGGEHR
ncbi:phosphoribosyltransferase family protein [Streptomyces sp. Li-HN-5-11]|uniref:phosphoribosyltransferase family protein n=1 Tax=Streptomyces sp. Li-HN-5-11 TaxID=3075432 RepID=UPI0028A62B92|nr:phosphoribosyltransferase family protein [Streptomyces sp. Li-HN-5-11]WNM32102.1 phosphoribosyltransferase family protein [Streptomyces sp. Li-HN-5-11]